MAAWFEVADLKEKIDAWCEVAGEAVERDLIETRFDESRFEAEIRALMIDVSPLLHTIRDLKRVEDHTVNIATRWSRTTTSSFPDLSAVQSAWLRMRWLSARSRL